MIILRKHTKWDRGHFLFVLHQKKKKKTLNWTCYALSCALQWHFSQPVLSRALKKNPTVLFATLAISYSCALRSEVFHDTVAPSGDEIMADTMRSSIPALTDDKLVLRATTIQRWLCYTNNLSGSANNGALTQSFIEIMHCFSAFWCFDLRYQIWVLLFLDRARKDGAVAQHVESKLWNSAASVVSSTPWRRCQVHIKTAPYSGLLVRCKNSSMSYNDERQLNHRRNK